MMSTISSFPSNFVDLVNKAEKDFPFCHYVLVDVLSLPKPEGGCNTLPNSCVGCPVFVFAVDVHSVNNTYEPRRESKANAYCSLAFTVRLRVFDGIVIRFDEQEETK